MNWNSLRTLWQQKAKPLGLSVSVKVLCIFVHRQIQTILVILCFQRLFLLLCGLLLLVKPKLQHSGCKEIIEQKVATKWNEKVLQHTYC